MRRYNDVILEVMSKYPGNYPNPWAVEQDLFLCTGLGGVRDGEFHMRNLGTFPDRRTPESILGDRGDENWERWESGERCSFYSAGPMAHPAMATYRYHDHDFPDMPHSLLRAMLNDEVDDLPYAWKDALMSFCHGLMRAEPEVHQFYLLAHTRCYAPADWKQHYQIYLKAFTLARRDATALWTKLSGHTPVVPNAEALSEQALSEARALLPPLE